MKERGLALLAGVSGAALAGYIMGGRLRERDANRALIEAGQMEDPTKMFGMDMDLVAGLALSGIGIFAQSQSGTIRSAGEFVEAMGQGALFYWVGSRAQSAGYNQGQAATDAAMGPGLAAA
jgi:hypothetical protein